MNNIQVYSLFASVLFANVNPALSCILGEDVHSAYKHSVSHLLDARLKKYVMDVTETVPKKHATRNPVY